MTEKVIAFKFRTKPRFSMDCVGVNTGCITNPNVLNKPTQFLMVLLH